MFTFVGARPPLCSSNAKIASPWIETHHGRQGDGVGKSLIARQVHRRSHRALGAVHRSQPRAAIPEALVDPSCLASSAAPFRRQLHLRAGRLRRRTAARLFDEIVTLSLTTQGKLLRFCSGAGAPGQQPDPASPMCASLRHQRGLQRKPCARGAAKTCRHPEFARLFAGGGAGGCLHPPLPLRRWNTIIGEPQAPASWPW